MRNDSDYEIDDSSSSTLCLGLFLMLHLFGTVIAMAGLILACFAIGDSRTAQRHLGDILSKPPTFAQHAGGTFVRASRVAARHGARLAAADPIGVLPHSPAPSTSQTSVFEANKNTSIVTMKALTFNSILFRDIYVHNFAC